MNKGKGILEQIENNKTYYKGNLDLETLEKFVLEISKQKFNRDIITLTDSERAYIQSKYKIRNKRKMKIKKLWSWLFPTKEKEEYLSEKDILKEGFVETNTKGHFTYFKKGNMNLKWNFHVSRRQITLKWGNSIRFIGIVETKEEFKSILGKIEKYYGHKG